MEAGLALGILGLLTVLPRIRLALAAPGTVDADESIALLMAQRIARSADFPLLHYGSAYLGSADAFLAAGMMKAFEDTAPVGRWIPILLSVALAVLTYHLGRRIGDTATAWIAGVYVALGPTLLVTWGAKMFLAYLDIAVLGNVLFLLLLQEGGAASADRSSPRWRRFGIGLVVGLGLWCHLLFAVYAAAAVAYRAWLVARGTRRIAEYFRGPGPRLEALGALTGALPLLVYNAVHRGASAEMFERAVDAQHGAFASLASRCYNLLVGAGPAFLGAIPSWRIFRSEFSMLLPPALVPVVLASVGLLAAIACLAALAVRGTPPERRGDAARAPATSALPVLRGLIGILLALGLLSATGLAFAAARIDWDAYEWIHGPGLPPSPLRLLLAESVAPHMAMYLLFAPLLLPLTPSRRDDSGALPDVTRAGVALLRINIAVCCLLYLATSYGLVRSARYLIPAYSSLPVLVALAARELNGRRRWLGYAWVAAILVVNLSVLGSFPPIEALQPAHYAGRPYATSDYRPLAASLDALGVRSVYAPFWVGFPLAFETEERIVPSDGRRGRVPEFDRRVAEDPRVTFVFSRGKFDDAAFAELLRRAGIPHHVADAEQFRIYHGAGLVRLRSPDLWPTVVRLLAYP
jgi:hypothetical protein